MRRDNLSNNLQLKERTITVYCASFIETAQKYNLNQIPINSDRVEMSPIGLRGWLKSSVIYQVPRNGCGSKTRKCYFYFTPKFRKKFRSLKEVEKYRKILKKHKENERAALAEYAALRQTREGRTLTEGMKFHVSVIITQCIIFIHEDVLYSV